MDTTAPTGTMLDDIERLLADADRAMATVVALLAAIDPADVIARAGQTLPSWLRATAGRTSSDERALLLAAHRLTHLPTVRAWLADGTIGWAVARSIVFATRRLTIGQLAWLDDTLVGDADRLTRLDADRVIAAVDRLVDDARPDLHSDRARRTFDRRYAQIQTGLDGSVQLYAEFDAEMGAAVIEALETTPTSPHPASDATGPDTASDDEATTAAADARRSRGQRHADALHALCLQRRATGTRSTTDTAASAPTPARPSLLVLTDIATLAGDDTPPRVTHTAELLWRSSRGPIRLTAGALDRIACHADIRPILTDGSVPLGVGEPTTNVGAPLRAALIARDGTCRFPACTAPADRCETHHLIPRHRSGATTLDNLALLCTAHHHAVHEGGWRATLHPDGTMTFHRRGRTHTTLPHSAQHPTPTRPPPRRRSTPRERRRAPAGAGDRPPTQSGMNATRAEGLPF